MPAQDKDPSPPSFGADELLDQVDAYEVSFDNWRAMTCLAMQVLPAHYLQRMADAVRGQAELRGIKIK